MRLLEAFLILVCALGSARAQSSAAIIGIDHIPVAVRNLDQAVESFRSLGFAIKPGRSHSNGIRNGHIKLVGPQAAHGLWLELRRAP